MVLYAPPNVINLPRQERRPSLGELFGQGFGQGLGQGIGQGYQDVQGKIKQQLEQAALQNALELIEPNASPLDNYMALLQAPANVRDLLLKSYPEYAKLQQTQNSNSILGEINNQFLGRTSASGQNSLSSFSSESQNPEMQNSDMQNNAQEMNQYNRENQNLKEGLDEGFSIDKKLLKSLPANVQEKIVDKIQKEREYNLKLNKFIIDKKEKEEKKLKPFVDKLASSAEASTIIVNSLQNMKQIREKNNLGISSPLRAFVQPETRADAGAYDTYGSQLLSLFKSQFPRGITQGEFKKIEEKWLPKSSNSNERNAAIEDAYKEIAKVLSRKVQIAEKYRKRDGSFPSNIESLVNENLAKDLESLKEKLLSDSPPVKQGDILDKLPNPKLYKKNDAFQDEKGNVYIHTGTGWKKLR